MGRESYETEELELPEDSISSLQNDQSELTLNAANDNSEDYDRIEVRCLVLEAGNALFIEANNNTLILIIDLEEESAQKIKRISIKKELQPGTFILVKTGGEGITLFQ